MKIPLFSKMATRSRGRKVVRASAARAVRGVEEDYYEAEPNMKLSHAFMVVLVLHVVAVGGIYAFNQINAKKNAGLVAGISGKIAQTAGAAAAPAKPAEPAPAQRLPGDADEPLPSVGGSVSSTQAVSAAPAAPVAAVVPKVQMTATKSATPAFESKPPAPAKPASAKTAPEPASASGSYKVQKGDNPYSIAKKLGVSSQELLKLNGIDDPKKLQIGQVLKVPSKAE